MQYTLKRKTNGSKQKDYKQYYVNYTFIFKKSFKYLKKKKFNETAADTVASTHFK